MNATVKFLIYCPISKTEGIGVKVNPLYEINRFWNQVKEKPDGHSRQQHQHQNADQNKKQDEFKLPPSDEQVDQAVEAFQTDAQTQANGLHAAVSGHGIGLKVVLTDGTGAVVRQFTGEEFLRLREATSKDGRIRGKILDQKL